MKDKLPPHSTESEQGVLGCILNDPQCLDACLGRLSGESFYEIRHRILWDDFSSHGIAGVDLILVVQRLKDSGKLEMVGGIAYLNEIQNAVPSSANLSQYIEAIEGKSKLRRLINTCTNTINEAYSLSGNKAESLIEKTESEIAKAASVHRELVLNQAQAVSAFTTDMERRIECHATGKRSGLETPWIDLDKKTDGLQFGEQFIVGARPSMGKTAIATNLIEHVCLKNKVPSVFVTLEMSPAAICRRIASSNLKISMGDLKSGFIGEGDYEKLNSFCILIKKSPLYFVDGVSGMTDVQICAELRRLKRKHDIQFAVIDYLQKIKGSSHEEKKTYEVGGVSSALKAVAKELNIALVTLAQLNRENEKDKGRMPRTSDLADSKQIEADADVIALLHRPRTTDEHIETSLIITKQRDGEIGSIDLIFTGKHCRFDSAEKNY